VVGVNGGECVGVCVKKRVDVLLDVVVSSSYCRGQRSVTILEEPFYGHCDLIIMRPQLTPTYPL